MRFASKIDIWLGTIIVLSSLLCLGAAWLVGHQGGTINILLGLLVLLSGTLLPLWILLSTHYHIARGQLRVTSGPFSWSIAIDEIQSVSETRNPLSSPALSLDRLLICYGNHKHIMVSPKNKNAFREVLEATDV